MTDFMASRAFGERYLSVLHKSKAQRRQIRGLQSKLALLRLVTEAQARELVTLRDALAVARHPRITSFSNTLDAMFGQFK